LKYENGRLSFGGTAVTDAATTWRGDVHVFTGSDNGKFWIRPGTVGVTKIGTSGMRLFFMGKSDVPGQSDSFQTIFSGPVYVSLPTNTTNATSITNGVDIIRQLRPILYANSSSQLSRGFTPIGAKSSGFVADEVSQVLPLSVDNAENGNKVLNYDSMIPYLVAAIKEQQAQIETLKQRIQTLENR
jgi:hypothetical protein